MAAKDNKSAPERSAFHEALEAFLGEWTAEGVSYGGADQPSDDPKKNGVPWVSSHTGAWHTGGFFLIQDERARPGGAVFDTLSVMGLDIGTGRYFCRSFENHGFARDYTVTHKGRVWKLIGETERGEITFSEDGSRQTIIWEWKPKDVWLPLCDRVATKRP